MQTWNKGHDMYKLSHVYIGQTVSILNIYFEYAMHGIIETWDKSNNGYMK